MTTFNEAYERIKEFYPNLHWVFEVDINAKKRVALAMNRDNGKNYMFLLFANGSFTDYAEVESKKLKTVNLSLVGLNGNAFNLMGAFQKQARKEGWTPEEINEVLDEAKSGDYHHLLNTLSERCNPEN